MRMPRALLVLAAAAALSLVLASARATPTTTIDAVEEDWQLVITAPDVAGVGPQITTVMSPTSNLSDPFIAFDMNYKEYPSFTPGGMQIQVWSNNSVTVTSSQGTGQFQTANETITWTQSMSLTGGNVVYGVNNGQSTTFGKFGQGNGLLAVSYPTSLTDLSGYTPTATVANSGASWESNLVTSLTLVEVRYYSHGTLVSTDTTSRSIPLK